jgi:hypothetical protein
LGNWVLLGEPIRWKLRHGEEIPTLARYRLFLGANGRYRSIWHIHTTVTEEGFPQAFPADLDGDGADELVFGGYCQGQVASFQNPVTALCQPSHQGVSKACISGNASPDVPKIFRLMRFFALLPMAQELL